MAISRKPLSIRDVAFRTSFGLGPEKTENQGPNRERKAGRWGESMVQRGASERCETGANPLETRGKRKPVTPENDPRETGLSFLNGGAGGNRTRVREHLAQSVYRFSPGFHSCRAGSPRTGVRPASQKESRAGPFWLRTFASPMGVTPGCGVWSLGRTDVAVSAAKLLHA